MTIRTAAATALVLSVLSLGLTGQSSSSARDTLPWAYSCLLPLWPDLPGVGLSVSLRVIPGDDRATEWVVWLRRHAAPSRGIDALVREPDGYRLAARWLTYAHAADPPRCDVVRLDFPVRECRVGQKQSAALLKLIEELEDIGLPVPHPRHTVPNGTRYDITVSGDVGAAEARVYGPADPEQPVGSEWDPAVRWANSLYRLLRGACRAKRFAGQ